MFFLLLGSLSPTDIKMQGMTLKKSRSLPSKDREDILLKSLEKNNLSKSISLYFIISFFISPFLPSLSLKQFKRKGSVVECWFPHTCEPNHSGVDLRSWRFRLQGGTSTDTIRRKKQTLSISMSNSHRHNIFSTFI